MAAAIKTSELQKQISSILKGADLTTLSAKKVRKQLEETFKVDLTSRKQEIDDIVMTCINEEMDKDGSEKEASVHSENKSESESSEYEAPPPKKKNNFKKEAKSRKSDSDSDKCEASPPKKKNSLKKETKSRKANSDSDDEMDDEAYARQLQEEEKKSLRRAASKNIGKKKEPRKKKISSGGPVRETPYNRKCILSEDLAQIVGAPQMARADVVKTMWALAKERNLFDPSNKRYIICDDQFMKVFGLKRVLMFSMMKYLKTHITDPLKKTKEDIE